MKTAHAFTSAGVILAVLGLLSVNAEAQRAPTIHYRPSNYGDNTDRFSSPEEADTWTIYDPLDRTAAALLRDHEYRVEWR
jgi:hypothetical protein